MELWQTLVQLVDVLLQLAGDLVYLALQGALLIAWIAWWLWGVDWSRTWPVLAGGAWAPLVLIIVAAALAWSQLAPSSCTCLGIVVVPNFWWQLGGVSLLVALTLFCGWLQGVFGWAPAYVDLEPPASAPHDQDHQPHGDDDREPHHH